MTTTAMTMKEELLTQMQAINEEIVVLQRKRGEVTQAIANLAATERGLKLGTVLVHRGVRYRISSFRWRYLDKINIHARRIRKDGTDGAVEQEIYGDFKVEPESEK